MYLALSLSVTDCMSLYVNLAACHIGIWCILCRVATTTHDSVCCWCSCCYNVADAGAAVDDAPDADTLYCCCCKRMMQKVWLYLANWWMEIDAKQSVTCMQLPGRSEMGDMGFFPLFSFQKCSKLWGEKMRLKTIRDLEIVVISAWRQSSYPDRLTLCKWLVCFGSSKCN